MNDSEREKLFLSAYDEHADAIFRFCFFKLMDREQAIDAAQEVFVKMWKYLRDGNIVEAPRAFLFVTASNHIKDIWRKKKAIPISLLEHDDEGRSFDAADEDADAERDIEYRQALHHFARLPDNERSLLQLRFVEGLAVKDIAAMLSERENTVAVRINRALGKLRVLYKESHGS